MAYHTLIDPEKRAAYDVHHRDTRRLTWRIFDQSTAPMGVDGERRKREGVLTLLYRKRVSEPEQPFLMLKEMEELLGVPREHLEFTVWYLRESQLIQRSDNGRFTITLKGAWTQPKRDIGAQDGIDISTDLRESERVPA